MTNDDAIQNLLRDIEAIAAKTRELMPSLGPNTHLMEGDSNWMKLIPRTDSRIADLAGFLRWARSVGISDGDVQRGIDAAFQDLSADEIEQARSLA